ncbi:MAG: hypothetical protein HY225_00845 [Candidatus Vogelbacteria bacterium]|nr:hypothetical protein [Candidatus Vogelbacteria bacterium]
MVNVVTAVLALVGMILTGTVLVKAHSEDKNSGFVHNHSEVTLDRCIALTIYGLLTVLFHMFA